MVHLKKKKKNLKKRKIADCNTLKETQFQLIQLNNTKRKTTQSKNGQKTYTDISPKKTCRGPIDT